MLASAADSGAYVTSSLATRAGAILNNFRKFLLFIKKSNIGTENVSVNQNLEFCVIF